MSFLDRQTRRRHPSQLSRSLVNYIAERRLSLFVMLIQLQIYFCYWIDTYIVRYFFNEAVKSQYKKNISPQPQNQLS